MRLKFPAFVRWRWTHRVFLQQYLSVVCNALTGLTNSSVIGELLNFEETGGMNLSSQYFSVADFYFEILKNLNPDTKLDLISKLSQSLKKSEEEPDVSLQSLFGAYQSEETADEIIEQLRASRVFDRNRETL